MNNEQIKENVEIAQATIKLDKQKLERSYLALKQIRELCPHTSKESWTNNDGGGQFKVERCNVCGAQKDGGL